MTTTSSSTFNNYATLTPLQPLPPISTVTNSTGKLLIVRTTPTSPLTTSSAHPNEHSARNCTSHEKNPLQNRRFVNQTSSSELFYAQSQSAPPPSPPTNSLNSFNGMPYNVNIKYEYDIKADEPPSPASSPLVANGNIQQVIWFVFFEFIRFI